MNKVFQSISCFHHKFKNYYIYPESFSSGRSAFPSMAQLH